MRRPPVPVASTMLAAALLAALAHASPAAARQSPTSGAGTSPRGPTLRVGVLLADADDSAGASLARGIELGLGEALHVAGLIGGLVHVVDSGRPGAADALAAAARAGTIDALLGGSTPEGCRLMASLAASTRVVWVNGICPLEPPDAAACAANVFHVAPTEAMRAHARRLAGATSDAEVVMWDATLERFGAAQLSDRFRRAFARPMDGAAWAGWTAAKAVWDAKVRTVGGSGLSLAETLAAPTFSLDAHKGRPLGFRAHDRRLRQPLYVRTADGRLAEVPRLARGASARAALDSLGADGPGCDGGSR